MNQRKLRYPSLVWLVPGWQGIVVKGVNVGMVGGHLGMPGVFVDVVDLRNVDQIVPGDVTVMSIFANPSPVPLPLTNLRGKR